MRSEISGFFGTIVYVYMIKTSDYEHCEEATGIHTRYGTCFGRFCTENDTGFVEIQFNGKPRNSLMQFYSSS